MSKVLSWTLVRVPFDRGLCEHRWSHPCTAWHGGASSLGALLERRLGDRSVLGETWVPSPEAWGGQPGQGESVSVPAAAERGQPGACAAPPGPLTLGEVLPLPCKRVHPPVSSGHRDLPHVPHGPPSRSPGPGLSLMSEEAGVRVPEAGGRSRRWNSQASRRWPPAPTTHPSPCCSRRRAAPVPPARKPRADRLCSESRRDSGGIGWEARAPPGGLGSRALRSAGPVGRGDRLPPAAQTWQNLPDGVLRLPLPGAHSAPYSSCRRTRLTFRPAVTCRVGLEARQAPARLSLRGTRHPLEAGAWQTPFLRGCMAKGSNG